MGEIHHTWADVAYGFFVPDGRTMPPIVAIVGIIAVLIFSLPMALSCKK